MEGNSAQIHLVRYRVCNKMGRMAASRVSIAEFRDFTPQYLAIRSGSRRSQVTGEYMTELDTRSTSPRVFISYTHDSNQHRERVLMLADSLRKHGVDCDLDQYEIALRQSDGPAWMAKMIRDADFVLMACTEEYLGAWNDDLPLSKRQGARWEILHIRNEHYKSGSKGDKFIPIIFDPNDAKFIPMAFVSATWYLITEDGGIDELYRRVTNQHITPKPALGEFVELPPPAERPTHRRPGEPAAGSPTTAGPNSNIASSVAEGIVVYGDKNQLILNIGQLNISKTENVANASEATPVSAGTGGDSGRDQASAAIGSLQAHQVTPRIDELCQQMAAGFPRTAIAGFEALKAQGWAACTSRERYRILANIGHCNAALGDEPSAARFYFEAYEHQKDDLDGIVHRAMGMVCLGQIPEALKICEDIIRVNPAHARAWRLLIANNAKDTPFEQLLGRVPVGLRSDPEVAAALSDAALTRGMIEEAIKHARVSHAATNSYRSSLILGHALLDQLLAQTRDTVDTTVTDADVKLARESRELCRQAVDALKDAEVPNDYGTALLSVALCDRVLGEHNAADQAICRAYEAAPNNLDVLIWHTQVLVRQERLDEAVDALLSYQGVGKDARTLMLLARALSMRGSPGDDKHAVAVLHGLLSKASEADVQEPGLVNALILYIQLGGCDSGTENVDSKVDQLPTRVESQYSRNLLRGYLYLVNGDKDKASEAARAASDCLGDDESADWQRQFLANLFEETGLFADALLTLKPVCPLDRLTSTTQRVLQLANATGDDATIMAICKSLRANGCVEESVVQLEQYTLIQYMEFSEAEQALSALLAVKPDAVWASVTRSMLGIETHHPDWVCENQDELPDVSTVDPIVGNLVVGVLMHRFDRQAAIDYAYSLFRRFPESPITHRSLFSAVFNPSGLRKEYEPPTEVAPGCAVTFSSEDRDPDKTIVFEDECDPPPSLDRQEMPPAGVWFDALKNLKTGDTFERPGSQAARVRCTITNIQHKAVYRANDVPRRMEERFPDDVFVVRFSVPRNADDAKTPREALGRAYDVIEEQTSHQDEVLKAFQPGEFPIALLSKVIGRSVLDLMDGLGLAPDKCIRCSLGTEPELRDAKTHLSGGAPIVLDTSAISTLAIINRLDILPPLKSRVVVPEAAIQTFRKLRNEVSRPIDGGRIGIVDGEPFLIEESASVRMERLDLLEHVISTLTTFESVGGRDIASLSPKARELLARMDDGTSHAIAIARGRSAILWTDDFAIARLARGEFGIKSFWTMAACLHLTKLKHLDESQLEDAAVDLIARNYRYTPVAPLTVYRAVERGEWDPDHHVVARILARIATSEEFLPSSWYPVIEATVAVLWRRADDLEQPRRVTFALIEQLSRTKEGDKVINALYERAERLMGAHLLAAASLRMIIEEWRDRGDGLIVL